MAQAIIRKLAFVATGTSHFTQAGYDSARSQPWWAQTQRCLEGRPLTGKVVAVTGANAGVGAAVAAGVARLGATTLLLCRSLERGRAAADAILKSDPQAVVQVEQVDVSSLASVAAFAERFNNSGGGGKEGGGNVGNGKGGKGGGLLHCLINNAGILPHERHVVEPEGFESSFATNVTGTMALTLALKPALLRAAEEAKKKKKKKKKAAAATGADADADADADAQAALSVPRVVFVSSGGMYTDPLRVDLPLDPQSRDAAAAATTSTPPTTPTPTTPSLPPFDGVRAYSRDKRRQVALAEALARAWSPLGIAVASYHPGWADTPGVQTALPSFRRRFEGKLREPEGGADTAIWMAAAPVAAEVGGGGGGGGGGEAAAAAGAAAAASLLPACCYLQPGEFYLDRRPQAKHLLGSSGRVAGTAYTAADADLLLARVVALLEDKTGRAVAV
jgi:dehydrogenase/reductase SDR family member 12